MVPSKTSVVSPVSVTVKVIPSVLVSDHTLILKLSATSGSRFMSLSMTRTTPTPVAEWVCCSHWISPIFQWTNDDVAAIAPSRLKKTTANPSSLYASRRPSVGPMPDSLCPLGVSKIPSPSTSCSNPISVTSPVNMPVDRPVSTNLYSSISDPQVSTLIE